MLTYKCPCTTSQLWIRWQFSASLKVLGKNKSDKFILNGSTLPHASTAPYFTLFQMFSSSTREVKEFWKKVIGIRVNISANDNTLFHYAVEAMCYVYRLFQAPCNHRDRDHSHDKEVVWWKRFCLDKTWLRLRFMVNHNLNHVLPRFAVLWQLQSLSQLIMSCF